MIPIAIGFYFAGLVYQIYEYLNDYRFRNSLDKLVITYTKKHKFLDVDKTFLTFWLFLFWPVLYFPGDS